MNEQQDKAYTNRRKHERKRQERRRKSKKQKFIAVFAILMLATIFCYGAYMLASLQNTAKAGYRPMDDLTEKEKQKKYSVDPIKDPVSILILGIDDNDERNLGSCRTDSMIVATMNPETDVISTVSIPRDTYTKIYTSETSYEGYNKINSAYTVGKEKSTVKTVEKLLDIPINFYVTVDFKAFEKIVNALGGITLDVDIPEPVNELSHDGKTNIHLEPGKQKINGEEALALARTRHVDNDIMRGKRQQDIVKAVINKATTVGSVTKYSKVLKAVDNHLWTDMDTDMMFNMAQTVMENKFKVKQYIFQWKSFENAEAESMVALYEDSLDYISHKLRYSLELDKPDERDKAGYELTTNEIVAQKTPELY